MKRQNPSFEEAMNAASLWCTAWEEGELSDEVLADRVFELLKTKAGARGFFAISLSSDSALMDRLPDTLIFQLRASGEAIVDITAKNLAMSTAMEIHHIRNKNTEQKAGSERIKQRCIELLRLLEPNSVKTRLENLLQATKQDKGIDVEFLNRWNYDNEQKKAIEISINSVAEK